MILDILEVPDPILREVSSKVTQFDDGLSQLADNMHETLKNSLTGIGLAAIQVGIPQRIIVIDTNRYGNKNGYKETMVNPTILQSRGRVGMKEGCLSVPGKEVYKHRAENVKVSFYTVKGEKKKVSLNGLAARVFLHEYDHLEGKVIA